MYAIGLIFAIANKININILTLNDFDDDLKKEFDLENGIYKN